MDKLRMHSPDLTQDNIARIRGLFPGCVSEARDEVTGTMRLVVDFDQLRQELSDHIVEGPQERYRLDWPGKREALAIANAPIAKTMRPCREESMNFDSTENLFIEGDNLDALKLLQESYLGKVKLIYIDPPYNTGGDFVYKDDFAEGYINFLERSNQRDSAGNKLVANSSANGRFHSDWLSFLYPRLKVARNLLKEDGCIAVSIDENELQNLWTICDEIFGSDNFVECVVYDKKAAAKGVPPVNMIVGVHEYILFYQKSPAFSFVGSPRSQEGFSNPDKDPRGPWRNTNCKSTTKDASDAFEVVDPKTGMSYISTWAFSKSEMDRMASIGELIFPKSPDGQVRKKEYYLEFKNSNTPIKSSWSLYDSQYNTQMLEELMGGKYFQNPKHINLMTDLIKYTTVRGEIIMDFFCGSGSTAHGIMAASSLDGWNRSFIMVQIAELIPPTSSAFKAGYSTIADIAKERIRRAGTKVLGGDCHSGWNRDVGFRLLKLDTSNMKDVYYRPDELNQTDLLNMVDNVKDGRSAEDLLFQVLVDWGVELTLPIRREMVQSKPIFFVDNNALVACFENDITEDLVKELAGFEPLRVVFRDNGFALDSVKINVEQIFRQLSPNTEVKSI